MATTLNQTFVLTSESMGSVCSSFFFSVSAGPSKVQVILGTGLPLMETGILMLFPALHVSRSWALTSRLRLGSTGK